MIRVAIVEDDAEVQGVLQEYVRRYTRQYGTCLLYTSPSPRDAHESRMPSSA